MSTFAPTPVGSLLREWRTSRKLSQMDLAGEAEVSTRHISFIETGRSKPSREMVLILASVMELPLRERNTLLLAAGFAPAYRETDLESPEMAQVKKTLELILKQAEPFGAVVMDRRWNIVMSNDAATRMTALLSSDMATLMGLGIPNMMRLLFHPAGLRNSIVNWEEVARAIIGRAHKEVQLDQDPAQRNIFEEALACPGVPEDFRAVDIVDDPPLLIPIHFRRDEFDARVFTTITTLGTAQDVTLQELRVEVFYPADEASERMLRAAAELPS
jgi:transcriptional regulator with XRE-family HTH domain